MPHLDGIKNPSKKRLHSLKVVHSGHEIEPYHTLTPISMCVCIPSARERNWTPPITVPSSGKSLDNQSRDPGKRGATYSMKSNLNSIQLHIFKCHFAIHFS